MKELVLNESVNLGGHRFSVNDLAQLSAANIQLGQIIGKLVGEEGPGGTVLVGVRETTTATDISYTGGWIYKGGHMWRVNPLPTTPTVSGHVIIFDYKIVNGSPVTVSYQSGGQFNVHIERQVDILYTTIANAPTGVLNVDYTLPFYVKFERLEDLISRTAVNTTHRQAVEAAWTELQGPAIALLVQGAVAILADSRIRYKVIGKTALLQVSIVLVSPSPRNFAIALPTALNIKNVIQPSVVALDTRNSTQTCAVSFSPASGSTPALMNFERGHNNTAQNTVSFNAILELT